MQMAVPPTHGRLQNAMQLLQRQVGGNQQAPPDRRLRAEQDNFDLIDLSRPFNGLGNRRGLAAPMLPSGTNSSWPVNASGPGESKRSGVQAIRRRSDFSIFLSVLYWPSA